MVMSTHCTAALEITHGQKGRSKQPPDAYWDDRLPRPTVTLLRGWNAAEREFKRTLELSPNSANTHKLHWLYLSSPGRHQEALAGIQECNPSRSAQSYVRVTIPERLE